MSSLGVKTPLTYDSGNGFTMLKTIPAVIKQNLKMIILTNPGERVMDPDFGVGIQTYLFSNYSEGIDGKISAKIHQQVNKYMPGLVIQDIDFYSIDPDTNSIAFRIVYFVPNIGTSDLLEFTI